MQENLLEVTGVRKQYPGFKLEDISFQVPKGTIMGLIGENGAGKSTTINAILNLIRTDAGRITFWGKELSEESLRMKEDIGVVYDGVNFYETLTPAKTEKVLRNAYKQWNTDLFYQYMMKFSLPLKKEIKTFSKGMKIKLCIAAALSHGSKFLIMDEATSGLDPVIRDEILDIFMEFVQDEEHSILISSHISSDLEKIADYITFIHQGRIILSESKDELIYNYGILKCGEDVFNNLDKNDILAYKKQEFGCDVLVRNKEAAQKKYKKAIVDNAGLDDILLLYVKGDKIV